MIDMKSKNRKAYKVKKVSKEILRESDGRVHTENIFQWDMRMALMFINYMADNISYLKRYEVDGSTYESIKAELFEVRDRLEMIDERFKEHTNRVA